MRESEKQSAIIVVGCAVAAVGLTFVLRNVLQLGVGASIGVGALAILVLVALGMLAAAALRVRESKADAAKTIEPIIKRYERSRNASQLLREYDTWAAGEHDPQLQMEFLKASAKALAADGFTKQARRQVQKASEMELAKFAPKQFEKFRAEVEEAIAERAEGAAGGNRAQRRAQKRGR